MPDRNPVNRELVSSAAAMNSFHRWCEPAPSNEKMMNCGALSPGASLVIGMLVGGRSPVAGALVSAASVLSRPYGSDVLASGAVTVWVTTTDADPVVCVWLPW